MQDQDRMAQKQERAIGILINSCHPCLVVGLSLVAKDGHPVASGWFTWMLLRVGAI